MPQLFSRMDELNWLTPSIADILEQGAAPPGGDGTIREQMVALQDKLTQLETPARVVNVRPTPSYTLFITRPDTVGRLGNRRTTTPNEIKRSLAQIAEENKDWRLGFLPQLQDVPDTLGILLRTDEHQALSLRRMLVRGPFRDHPSTLAIALGNTLDQRLIVRDLAQIGNLVVAGDDPVKSHFIYGTLLTLLTLNTPGEMRLALVGPGSATFRMLINTPHALGRVLVKPEDGQRLFDGLVKEVQKRQKWLEEHDVENIGQYNDLLREQGKTKVPRIGLVIDSLSDENWQSARNEWLPVIRDIAQDGGRAGIHLILAVDSMQQPDLPSTLEKLISLYVVSRSVAGDYSEQLPNFHGSLMRFIDALIIERIDEGEQNIVPVELCQISQNEIEAAVEYWKYATQQRKRESESAAVSGTTGVTGMLDRPVTGTLSPQPASPVPETDEQSDEETRAGTIQLPVESAERPQVTLEQAQALAAYLGWIGIGPLQDILGMSVSEAQRTLMVLKTMGIVEDNASPTPRFVRLINSPEQSTE